MQDTERVERILCEVRALNMGKWILGAGETAMAERVCSLLSMRVLGAKVVFFNDTAVIRVRMGVRGEQRTVTAGMDVLRQLVEPILHGGLDPDIVSKAVEAIRRALPDDVERLQSEVSRASEEITSNSDLVKQTKEAMVKTRTKKFLTERENLVSKMASLLSSGWTIDQLRDAVNTSACRNVMSS